MTTLCLAMVGHGDIARPCRRPGSSNHYGCCCQAHAQYFLAHGGQPQRPAWVIAREAQAEADAQAAREAAWRVNTANERAIALARHRYSDSYQPSPPVRRGNGHTSYRNSYEDDDDPWRNEFSSGYYGAPRYTDHQAAYDAWFANN